MKDQQQNPSENRGQSHRGKNKKHFYKNRPPRNFWKNTLINKALDLVVVVLGVLLAIYLYKGAVSSEQKESEQVYVKGLIDDLAKDIEELDRNLTGHKLDYDAIVVYVERYSKGESVDDSLASALSAILTLNTFSKGHSSTYTSLNSLADPGILGPEVRGKVAAYYNQYHAIEHFERVYTELLFDVNHYFSPYCDYTLRKITDKSILGKVQTKNLLLLTAAQLEDGIENYENTIVMAEALKKSLQEM